MNELTLLQTLGIIFGPAGAAFIGVKVSLNGLKFRMSKVEEKVDKLDEGVVQVSKDVAALNALHRHLDQLRNP